MKAVGWAFWRLWTTFWHKTDENPRFRSKQTEDKDEQRINFTENLQKTVAIAAKLCYNIDCGWYLFPPHTVY